MTLPLQAESEKGKSIPMNSLLNICGKGIRVRGRLIRFAHVDAEKFLFLEDPKPVLEGLRKCGARADLFTFMQRPPDTSPKYTYPMEWDNLAVLPVTTFENWWTQQIGFKARNKAKQAEKKGVVIREIPFSEDLVKGIQEVYNESPVRQGTRNTNYGKDFETVYREEATYLDSSIFIGAFLGDALIGFIKLLLDETRTQAGLLNIVSMVRHRDKAPTNALIAESVRSCAQRGIAYLAYQNLTYGNKISDNLTKFKEANGFLRVDLPRYYVPLTRMGALVFRRGLHKGLLNCVPESLLAKLRELRNAWYTRKYRSALEPS